MNCDCIAGFPIARLLHVRHFVDEMRCVRRILLVGDGDGRFLQFLLRMNEDASIDSVECRSEMIRLAKARVLYSRRVEFHESDSALWIGTHGPYDLLVMHFFLDCFHQEQVEAIAAGLSHATAVGGQGDPLRLPLSNHRTYAVAGTATDQDNALVVPINYVAHRPAAARIMRQHSSPMASSDRKESPSAGGLLTSERWTRL